MEYQEKARKRIEHWIDHNASHMRAYQSFADELENAGYRNSAREIRKLATLTEQSTGHLSEALDGLTGLSVSTP